MLKNNISLDVKIKCLEESITQAEIARKIGTTAPYVSRMINHPETIVNRTFVEILNQLGYDIRLTYEKKKA